MQESVIDFPKEGLCPDVWEKVVASDAMHEVWQLKNEVRDKIRSLISMILETAKIGNADNYIVHITGSITSNSYTDNADIDLHFLYRDGFALKMRTELLQQVVRNAFEAIKRTNLGMTMIGKHPIEVYFQENKFQDFMSVGCYDFFNLKWLVGPEFIDQSFNPYSEYYAEIQAKSNNLAKQIRNMIFSIYEMAVVFKKNIGKDYAQTLRPIFLSRLEEVQKMYDSIRQMRKVYSSPTSVQQALEYRLSRKWKIADATFKLFDKYGYMAIMKQFIEDYKIIFSTNDVDQEVVEDILNTVKNYISNADKLAEKEMYEGELNESMMSKVLLAALLAIPGILPAKTIQKAIDELPTYSYIVDVANKNCKMYGQYTAFQAANIIARTLFAEARQDGKDGFNAVASVIWNRAEGNPNDLALVCKKYAWSNKHKRDIYQFSCWGSMKRSSWNPNNFKVKLPDSVINGSKEQKLWEEAMEIAASMLRGDFKPTIDSTMYYNPNKANPSWGSQLKNVKKIGSHLFGTLKNHSEFK